VSYWESERNPGTQEFIYSFTNCRGAICKEAVIYNYGQADQGLTNYSRDVSILVSMDGANWSTVTNVSLAASCEPQSFDMNSVTGRYIKLVVYSGIHSDAWQLAEFELHGSLTSDADADGMDDNWEMQWFGNFDRNGGSDDFENDQLTDVDEFIHGSNPTSSDTDGDVMPDSWEVQYGLQVAVDDGDDDIDGDGISNRGEYIAGSIPTDKYSVFSLPKPRSVGFSTEHIYQDPTNSLWCTSMVFTTTAIVFEWSALPGRVYQLYSTTNLNGSWSAASELIMGGRDVSLTNSVANPSSMKFYRLNVDMQP
jgi:hypothetical protein